MSLSMKALQPLIPLTNSPSVPMSDHRRCIGFATLDVLQDSFLCSPPLLADTLTALPKGHGNGSEGVRGLMHLLHMLWIGVWTGGSGD